MTSSIYVNKIPPPELLDKNIPFHQAREADVHVPPRKEGKVDGYIDDLIPVVVHEGDNALRAANAVPLAIHIVGRPVNKKEPIQRDDLLSFSKLLGEGCMAELKTVTGWTINTRLFRVILPDDKFANWTKDINDLISSKIAKHSDVETIEGRLNHVGYIIPTARHFLHPIRSLTRRCANKACKITTIESNYLKLWTKFLKDANEGISINNLVYRKPTHLRWDDSCPIGIGGVSITGTAYRYNLPRHLQGRVSNNALEFLASVVGCWFDIIEYLTLEIIHPQLAGYSSQILWRNITPSTYK